jgi:hypothetical protein
VPPLPEGCAMVARTDLTRAIGASSPTVAYRRYRVLGNLSEVSMRPRGFRLKLELI